MQKGPKLEGDDWTMITHAGGRVARCSSIRAADSPALRNLKKEGEYFVCSDFCKPGSLDELQEDGVWTQVPRYTFEGMDIEVTN